jgi:hypothetical protein
MYLLWNTHCQFGKDDTKNMKTTLNNFFIIAFIGVVLNFGGC